MPHNTETEAQIWLSKYHLKLADQLGELPQNRRKRRQQIEIMIEEAARQAGILELRV